MPLVCAARRVRSLARRVRGAGAALAGGRRAAAEPGAGGRTSCGARRAARAVTELLPLPPPPPLWSVRASLARKPEEGRQGGETPRYRNFRKLTI